MNKLLYILFGLFFFSLNSQSQTEDDFFDFMDKESKEFDLFIDKATKDFVDFMRNPWVKKDSEKPVEKPKEPKPVAPVNYDPTKAPSDDEPIEIDISKILDLSTPNDKIPTVKNKDLDGLDFGSPTVPVTKPTSPTTKPTVPTTKPTAPVTKPTSPTTKPTVPTTKPTAPVTKPTSPTTKPTVPTTKPTVPTTPVTTPSRNSALYQPSSDRVKVDYMGMAIYMPSALKGQCRLSNLKENAIADAYENLYRADYKTLVSNLNQLCKDLNLNDWGVYTAVRATSNALCNNDNESVVMQQFLLNTLGYRAKMARSAASNQLILFVAINSQLYGVPSCVIDGQKFYCIDDKNVSTFYMCEKEDPSAKKSVSMKITSAPTFSGEMRTTSHKANRANTTITVQVPESLAEFYNSFPQCDYDIYTTAPVYRDLNYKMLSSLEAAIAGKSQQDAANILINFVQFGFEYATDDQQFGYEKPFFIEELFYYPYCDCEDRSILFTYLVKQLLGLDTVLLYYPGHMATAVRFTEDIDGDYLTYQGQKYVICDPTYIGASIGRAMPNFRSVAAEVHKY